jgi:hypothetical protein
MEIKFVRTSSGLKNASQVEEVSVNLTRRKLLLGLASIGFFPDVLQESITDIPVVVVTLPGSLNTSNPHYFYLRVWEEVIGKMSGKRKIPVALRRLFGKGDKFSARIDCRSATSSPDNAMISAFLEMLVSKEVQPWDINLWARREVDAKRAGYNLKVDGQQLEIGGVEKENYRGNPQLSGYNGKKVYRPAWFDNKSRFPLVSHLAGGKGNLLFTTPKYHRFCGVDGVLASALGAVGRSGKLISSPDNMIRAICEIWQQFLQQNSVLNVVDATAALYEGGPVGLPYYRFNARKLIIGRDPVAVDKVALEVIDKKRDEVKYKPAAENGMKLLEKAEEMGLGSLKTKVIQINILE